MNVRFCVLGSGSKGNATLVLAPEAHVLLDAGFAPDELAARMEGTGASWETLAAVVLTHTHADHLKKKCLALCAEHEVEFICHEQHARHLAGGRYYNRLHDKGLLRTFNSEPFEIRARRARIQHSRHKAQSTQPQATGSQEQGLSVPQADEAVMRFHPLRVPHDSPPTFGFRIEARCAETQSVRWVKLAYLSDLGRLDDGLVRALADVELLALEFNHDEEMERNSGRHPLLIERVLGDEGHLSNAQAAEAFRRVLEHASNGGPRYLVQLHLSQECNDPEVAFKAAREIAFLMGAHTQVFSTRQDKRGTILKLD
ncbi:MAG: MBL fold metallo-hydrolase [Planctomycetota bacterium]|nr:MBL fold metallo-hydrolase [Planctomycetota bacterium]